MSTHSPVLRTVRSSLVACVSRAWGVAPLAVIASLAGTVGGCTEASKASTPGPITTNGYDASPYDAGITKDATAKDAGWETPTTCSPAPKDGEFFALTAKDIVDDPISMCRFRGQVILVVNVASKCGNTPQYTPLERMYGDLKSKGFVILGFPCNQFGAQESGSNAEIQGFCQQTYGVDFPMFGKIDVNGANTHPVYTWLKAQPGGAGDIDWNFAKFLIGRDGKLIKRWASSVQPDAPEITQAINDALAK